jgi:hypothetical protein
MIPLVDGIAARDEILAFFSPCASVRRRLEEIFC